MNSPRWMPVLVASSVASLLVFADGAGAATVDLSPIKDNTLIEAPLGNSNGAGDGIWSGNVGTLGSGSSRRGLLAFDLSSIPAGSTVNTVTLRMEMAMAPNGTLRAISLHRVGADWGEAGSLGAGTGAPAQPGDATWQHRFFDTTTWSTAGGDFDPVQSASQSVGDVGPYSWTGAGLVADVQFWVDNAASNFGWLVMGNEGLNSTVKKFYSREGFIPPVLSVDYTPGGTDVGSGPGSDRVEFAAPWPTPASGPVRLSYTLPVRARVTLSIHDAHGRLVRSLVAGAIASAGRHAEVWDGRDESGERSASGIYFANLLVDDVPRFRRIALLR